MYFKMILKYANKYACLYIYYIEMQTIFKVNNIQFYNTIVCKYDYIQHGY